MQNGITKLSFTKQFLRGKNLLAGAGLVIQQDNNRKHLPKLCKTYLLGKHKVGKLKIIEIMSIFERNILEYVEKDEGAA